MIQDKKPDENQPSDDTEKGRINYENGKSETDPAGTDPERYENTFSDNPSHNEKPKKDTNEGRMINPDKGKQ